MRSATDFVNYAMQRSAVASVPNARTLSLGNFLAQSSAMAILREKDNVCRKQSTQVVGLWVPVQVTEEIEVEEAYIMDPHGSPGREYRIRMRLTDPTTYPPEAGISFEQVFTHSTSWKDAVCGEKFIPSSVITQSQL